MCFPLTVCYFSSLHCWVCTKLLIHPGPGWSLHCHSSHIYLPPTLLHEASRCQYWQKGVGAEVCQAIIEYWSFSSNMQFAKKKDYLFITKCKNLSNPSCDKNPIHISISGGCHCGRGFTAGSSSSLVLLVESVPQSLPLSIFSTAIFKFLAILWIWQTWKTSL